MHKLVIAFDTADRMNIGDTEGLISALGILDADATVETEETKEFTAPATIVLALKIGIPTAAAIAVIVSYLYKAFHCGVLVDLRERPPLVTKMPSLQRGTVLTIDKDGNETTRESLSIDQIAELIKSMLPAGEAPANVS